jgi:hypothetical protein
MRQNFFAIAVSSACPANFDRFASADFFVRASSVFTRAIVVALLAIGAALISAATVCAVETNWQGPASVAADWFESSNWTSRVPELVDDVSIGSNGIARITTGDAAARNIRVGESSIGSIVQIGGWLEVEQSLVLSTPASEGIVYDLDGGILSVETTQIGGTGDALFRHTSGTHSSGLLILGGYEGSSFGADNVGIYELGAGANLHTGSMDIGYQGKGTMTVSGGSVDVANLLRIGGMTRDVQSHLFINSGELNVGTMIVGHNGFGGVSQLNGLVVAEHDLVIGDVAGCLCNPVGSYALEGGTLETRGMASIGYGSGIGAFAQTGGIHRAEWIDLGEDGAAGTYVIENGLLEAETVSVQGPAGRFRIEGGGGEIDISGQFAMSKFDGPDQAPRLELVVDDEGVATIQVTDRAFLTGYLDVHFDASADKTPGTVYEFLTAGNGIEGTLMLTGNDADRVRLSIDGNSARITVVPEPGTLMIATCASCVFVARVWRRRHGIR